MSRHKIAYSAGINPQGNNYPKLFALSHDISAPLEIMIQSNIWILKRHKKTTTD